jgi:hypothetical protein
MTKQNNPPTRRRTRGFQRTSTLLQGQIREVGESRGFAVSRLLTHWAEIVGEETARTALPVKVSYSQGGFGATLTLLTTGSQAPMLQADLPRIRDKVNTCYGYSAIARIRITQTAATGFAEGQVAFSGATSASPTSPRVADSKIIDNAKTTARAVHDAGLRTALEELGKNVLTKAKR